MRRLFVMASLAGLAIAIAGRAAAVDNSTRQRNAYGPQYYFQSTPYMPTPVVTRPFVHPAATYPVPPNKNLPARPTRATLHPAPSSASSSSTSASSPSTTTSATTPSTSSANASYSYNPYYGSGYYYGNGPLGLGLYSYGQTYSPYAYSPYEAYYSPYAYSYSSPYSYSPYSYSPYARTSYGGYSAYAGPIFYPFGQLYGPGPVMQMLGFGQ